MGLATRCPSSAALVDDTAGGAFDMQLQAAPLTPSSIQAKCGQSSGGRSCWLVPDELPVDHSAVIIARGWLELVVSQVEVADLAGRVQDEGGTGRL
jgi:hypothetical protein